jgi:hypothetical protein
MPIESAPWVHVRVDVPALLAKLVKMGYQNETVLNGATVTGGIVVGPETWGKHLTIAEVANRTMWLKSGVKATAPATVATQWLKNDDAVVDYFVDSVSGSDSNTGTSAARPWRSLARLASVQVGPSMQVKLARGGVWRAGLTIAGGGSATAPMVYTSYGPASAPKPLLLGSRAVGGAGNWSAVLGSPGQWRTFPSQLVPAPGALSLLHNADYAAGSSAFWGLWNENPEGDSHVRGGVNSSVVPPAAGVKESFGIRFRDMGTAPASYTQLYATNVSVIAGRSYRLSFWAKASVDLNVSEVALFSMAPPYTPFAVAGGPVLLRGGSGGESGGWSQYHVDFAATVTASRTLGNQGRITWLFANGGSPNGKSHPTGGLSDNADVWLAGATFRHVIDAHPERVSFGMNRDVGNLLLFSEKEATVQSEPDQTGWKMWAISDVKKTGDFHFDRYTKLLTVFCAVGPPHACWPGGVEAALDLTQVNMNGASHVVVDGLALRYGAAHGINGGNVKNIVVRNCDISWIGGGVLSYDFRSTGKPVRFGNGIQWWNGAKDVEVYNNRLWQIYDTPLTNQGEVCTSNGGSAEGCAMRNISYHHNLATNSGMACVEIWYADKGATMDNIRFENNLCGNIGNGGWSAAQRADPAGRSVCFYHNLAKSTFISIRNNLIYQSVGFEAMIYLSDPWALWAGAALEFDNNAMFKTAVTPPPAPPHDGSLDEQEDFLKLIGASPMHIHSAADFAQFSKGHAGSGSGAQTVLTDPKFNGLPTAGGGVVAMEALTHGSIKAGSPLKGAGASVAWTTDFNGVPIPQNKPDIGPFQTRSKNDDFAADPPTVWLPRGITGGGAFFSPAFHPTDATLLAVTTDMGSVYRSSSAGDSWETLPFRQASGGRPAQVRFTEKAGLQYVISTRTQAGSDGLVPSKSTDGGKTFHALDGDPTHGSAAFLDTDAKTGTRLVLADRQSLYSSTDSGSSFSKIYTARHSSLGLRVAGAVCFGAGGEVVVGTNEGVVVMHGEGKPAILLAGPSKAEGIFGFATAMSTESGSLRLFALTVPRAMSSSSAMIETGFTQSIDLYSAEWSRSSAALSWKRVSGLPPLVGKGGYLGATFVRTDPSGAVYLAGQCANDCLPIQASSGGYAFIVKSPPAAQGGNWTHLYLAEENTRTGWEGPWKDGPLGDRFSFGGGALGFAVAAPTAVGGAPRLAFTDDGFLHGSFDGGKSFDALYVRKAERSPFGVKAPVARSWQGNGLMDQS